MENITLVGVQTKQYAEISSLISAYLALHHLKARLIESHDLSLMLSINVSAVPAVIYKDLRLSLGNRPEDIQHALKTLFDKIREEASAQSGTCSGCGKCKCGNNQMKETEAGS